MPNPHFDHVKSTKPTAEYLTEMFFFDSENSERLFNQYRPEHYSNEDFLKNYSIRSIPASDYLRDFSETPEKGKHTFNFYKNDEAGIYYPSSPISKYLVGKSSTFATSHLMILERSSGESERVIRLFSAERVARGLLVFGDTAFVNGNADKKGGSRYTVCGSNTIV